MTGTEWSVRVRTAQGKTTTASVRGQTVVVGPALNFDSKSKSASALELAFSAYGADLLSTFMVLATRARIPIHAGEVLVTGSLQNALTHLGVIGEDGHPGIESLAVTLYVTTEGDEQSLAPVWNLTLERSPLHQTYIRCASVDARLVIQ